ncbi:hypothetical protein EWB00_001424 [Schistosoma japonicum]|uniref:Uncharacterized protein n=1 Tax=Schistosoma japonicum TaxID=6182 RepID=A0A4Z2DFQ3_SCHJA|nr:hypothetical protein EWB00_001424 [Schistosoma japonicum]
MICPLRQLTRLSTFEKSHLKLLCFIMKSHPLPKFISPFTPPKRNISNFLLFVLLSMFLRDNLSLDLNPYNIVQGKSFTRSVSISESTSTPPGCINTSHSVIGDCLPSIRSASGEGGSTTSDISFSPFSSAATAITPESPLPDPDCCFQSNPLTSFNSIHSDGGDISPVQHSTATTNMSANNGDENIIINTGNSPKSLNETNISSQPADYDNDNQQNISCTSTSSCSSTSALQQFDENTYNYIVLFQNPITLRTVNFLAHLLDSRLSPDWRLPLEHWQRNATKSLNISQSYPPPTTTTTTTTSSNTTQMISSINNTEFAQSSDQEVCTIKRFKPNNSQTHITSNESSVISNNASRKIPPTSSSSSACDQSQPVPPTFITARLILCARNLADHFESRYRDKLGSLLEDVARLSSNNHNNNSNCDTDDQSCIDETHKATSTGTADNNVINDNRSVKSDDARSAGVSSGIHFSGDDESLQTRLEMARCQFHSVLEELFSERINWGRIIAMLAFLRALCEVVEENRRLMNCHPELSTASPGNEQVQHNTSDCNTQLSSTDPSPSCSYESTYNKLQDNKKLKTSGEIYQSDANDIKLLTFIRPCEADYALWTAEFIHGPRELWNWISSHGNWEGLISFESQRDETNPLSSTTASIGNTNNSLIGLVTGFTDDETLRSLRNALTSVATIAVGAVGLVAAYRFLSRHL